LILDLTLDSGFRVGEGGRLRGGGDKSIAMLGTKEFVTFDDLT
jgi:hypothetical protein